ncbi:Death-Associated Protein Kinase 1 [Manis pentadactyla]|nr:Death-Associated Protein Kinase 1 [Manis pentadactyla]
MRSHSMVFELGLSKGTLEVWWPLPTTHTAPPYHSMKAINIQNAYVHGSQQAEIHVVPSCGAQAVTPQLLTKEEFKVMNGLQKKKHRKGKCSRNLPLLRPPICGPDGGRLPDSWEEQDGYYIAITISMFYGDIHNFLHNVTNFSTVKIFLWLGLGLSDMWVIVGV